MAMVRVNGLMYPQPNLWIPTGASGNGISQTISATGDKMLWHGQVRWFDGAASKAIRKFHFQPGTVVSAGGSGMILSLQDMDLTTGQPPRPDGTQDQSVSFALSTISTSTWFTSPAFSADRTVNPGDYIGVVIEFDGGGRLGSDSLQFTHNPISNSPACPGWAYSMVIFHSGFWDDNFSGGARGQPQAMLEFSDGTFGQIGNSMPTSFFSGDTYNTTTTFDEFALRFKLPFDCTVDGAWLQLSAGGITGRGVQINLYDASSVSLGAINIDSDVTWNTAVAARHEVTFPSEIALTKNTLYRLGILATTTGNVSNSRFTTSSSFLSAFEGGVEFYQSKRKAGGAWTDDNNTRPQCGLRISKIGNGA